MKDFKAISHTVGNEIKQKIFGKSDYGNDDWKKANFEWYEKIHDENSSLHDSFMKYFDNKKNSIKTVLEVGCGAGIYPIKYKKIFGGLQYTGVDFSETNIEYCKKQSQFNFVAGDFIKMNVNQQYDLVYSHAVIDHVYDIDVFLRNLLRSCKKYAYINAYRGFFPDLEKHEMKWRDDDNCYYNKISVSTIKDVIEKENITEKQVSIYAHNNLEKQVSISDQLVIEIDKTNT